MASPQLHIVDDGDAFQQQVCQLIVDASRKAVASSGHFSVGFSGGSAAKVVCAGLRPRRDLEWDKWHAFTCDERHVPLSSEDSNIAYIKRELLSHVGVPASNVYAIDPSVGVSEAAEDYVRKIRTLYPDETQIPAFDLLILGMGPDGHTCSLFPGHAGLEEASKLVIAITDSPKPPPQRITLTYPILNQAKCVVVIATGASKADAVCRSLEPGPGVPPLPVGRVQPVSGELHWFMDSAASSKLANRIPTLTRTSSLLHRPVISSYFTDIAAKTVQTTFGSGLRSKLF